MSDTPRRPLAEMEQIAAELVEELRPYCERIEVAGSLRWQKPDIGDVEIVCIPKVDSVTHEGELFAGQPTDLLHRYCELRTDGEVWKHRLDKNGRKSFGVKYKRLLIHKPCGRWIPVDLFSVLPPAQFGVIFAIRTGPADFSRLLVTQRHKGGHLPTGCEVRDGAVWRGDQIVPCPEESDFLTLCGLEITCSCCIRGGIYNGFASGPTVFTCPKGCSCHD